MPMFLAWELNGTYRLTIGQRMQRILTHHPEIRTAPSALPKRFRVPAGFRLLQPNSIDTDCTWNPRDRGKLEYLIYDKVDTACTLDLRSMQASCRNLPDHDPNCMHCRFLECDQPVERQLFVQDVMWWWNVARGRCMSCRASFCGRKRVSWSLQRRDDRVNHYPSNICAVLCVSCNAHASPGKCSYGSGAVY